MFDQLQPLVEIFGVAESHQIRAVIAVFVYTVREPLAVFLYSVQLPVIHGEIHIAQSPGHHAVHEDVVYPEEGNPFGHQVHVVDEVGGDGREVSVTVGETVALFGPLFSRHCLLAEPGDGNLYVNNHVAARLNISIF